MKSRDFNDGTLISVNETEHGRKYLKEGKADIFFVF